MAEGSNPRGRATVVVLTLIAAPLALALETALRTLLFPPEFAEVRVLLEPGLTPVAWWVFALAWPVGAVGVGLQRRLADRKLARIPRGADPGIRARAFIGAFFLSASIVQIPAIVATLLFMLGASLTPVVATMGVATVAIAIQAVRAR